MCLAHKPLAAPLGFTLLGFPAGALAGFRPTSSLALRASRPLRLGVSIGPCPGLPGFPSKLRKADRPSLLGFRTTPIPFIQAHPRPSYLVHFAQPNTLLCLLYAL
jgi:hypothetical protein